jgi:PIN domain nuclease of toxin-antitoxin system
MKLLFDSHALVWFLKGDERFPSLLRERLEREETQFVISAACVGEIATKVRRGRWPEASPVLDNLTAVLATSLYIPLAISIEHARVAGLFAWRHQDPFDRILAAQSQIEGVPLITADPVFRDFGTAVMW